MKKLLFALIILSACSKQYFPPPPPPPIVVTKQWHTDVEFHALVDTAKDNTIIDFHGDSFIVSHTAYLTKNIGFRNGYLKREKQIIYTLVNEITPSLFLFNSVAGLAVGDKITAKLDSNSFNQITKISGDTVTLFVPWTDRKFADGELFFKSISFFEVPSYYSYNNIDLGFDNIVFDGNRDENTGTYYWDSNPALVLLTKGSAVLYGCEFKNSPNESVVGHRLDIFYCNFHDLNGSGVHFSADKQFFKEEDIHSTIHHCTFTNTNKIPDSITGHSEGAITHSNSGGYYEAFNNVFKNVGESVIGNLYHSVSVADYGTNNIYFHDNTIDSAGRMIFAITAFGETIKNVIIRGNYITKMPPQDYSKELLYNPEIYLEQQ